jgi:drug/metabolite transporter (DMT)-like permease
MSQRAKALMALLLATFFGATAGASGKILLETNAPFVVAFWRFGLAFLIILPLFILTKPKNFSQQLKNILPIALLSSINILLFFLALTMTTANAAAVIYAATPILTALLSGKVVGEKLTRRKAIGILLAFIGVLFILILPSMNKGHVPIGDTRGNIIIFIAACSWALYTIGSRYLIAQKKYTTLTISTVSIATTTLITLVFSLITNPPQELTALFTTPKLFGTALYMGLFVTVGMYLLYQYAIAHLSATTASFSNFIGPIFGFAINALILGEILTFEFFLGSALVLLGTFLTSSSGVKALFRSSR